MHIHTLYAYTHTRCTNLGTWKQRCAYTVYTIWWHMRAWGCIYQMSVYTIYGDKRMHMRSCSFFFLLFYFSFFCLFCISEEPLWNYQIQPPGEPFWPRFYKPAPALPAWLLSIFIPLHPVSAFACKLERSQTFVLTFGCIGLQLASPKSAFVHNEGGGICLCSCVCVHMSIPGLRGLRYMVCVLVMLQQSLYSVCHAGSALCPFKTFLWIKYSQAPCLYNVI